MGGLVGPEGIELKTEDLCDAGTMILARLAQIVTLLPSRPSFAFDGRPRQVVTKTSASNLGPRTSVAHSQSGGRLRERAANVNLVPRGAPRNSVRKQP